MYMELRQWHLEKHVISNFGKSDWKSDNLPKIWEGGGTEVSGNHLTDVMTEEDAAIDSTLLDYEVINLIAFHVDLRKRGIIKEEESDSILSALCSYLEKKIRVDPEEEDIHAYLENRIREAIGKSAENLRLFLSRNEQSQCNLRSFYVDHLLALAETLLKGSKELRNISIISKGKMPGFTHWRQAMPIAISTYYDYISRILLDLSKDAFLLIKKFRNFSPFGMGSTLIFFPRYEQRAESIESLSSSLIILLFLRSTSQEIWDSKTGQATRLRHHFTVALMIWKYCPLFQE